MAQPVLADMIVGESCDLQPDVMNRVDLKQPLDPLPLRCVANVPGVLVDGMNIQASRSSIWRCTGLLRRWQIQSGRKDSDAGTSRICGLVLRITRFGANG